MSTHFPSWDPGLRQALRRLQMSSHKQEKGRSFSWPRSGELGNPFLRPPPPMSSGWIFLVLQGWPLGPSLPFILFPTGHGGIVSSVRACACVHICARACTCACISVRVCARACICVCMRVCVLGGRKRKSSLLTPSLNSKALRLWGPPPQPSPGKSR